LAPSQAGTWSGSVAVVTSAGSATVQLRVRRRRRVVGGGTAIRHLGRRVAVNSQAALAGTSLVVTPNAAGRGRLGLLADSVPRPPSALVRHHHRPGQRRGRRRSGPRQPRGRRAETSVGGTGGAWGRRIPASPSRSTPSRTADPSANFIGVATTGGGLAYNQTATNIRPCANSTHHIDVVVAGGHLTVAVDGVAKLDSTVALPATALVGFTASTGGLTIVTDHQRHAQLLSASSCCARFRLMANCESSSGTTDNRDCRKGDSWRSRVSLELGQRQDA